MNIRVPPTNLNFPDFKTQAHWLVWKNQHTFKIPKTADQI